MDVKGEVSPDSESRGVLVDRRVPRPGRTLQIYLRKPLQAQALQELLKTVKPGGTAAHKAA